MTMPHRYGRQVITSAWIRTVEPMQEPVTVAEAKQHARVNQIQDDAMIARYIQVARETAEDYLGRGLFTQTWQLTLQDFAEEIFLPRACPLQNDALANPSTAPVVQYYDANNAIQTLATTYYDVDTASRPARIVRASNQTWPVTRADRLAGRVVITYVIGWTDIEDIPERIKQGIRSYVAYLIDDRDGLEDNAERAVMAAQACWSDRVEWIEPACGWSMWWNYAIRALG